MFSLCKKKRIEDHACFVTFSIQFLPIEHSKDYADNEFHTDFGTAQRLELQRWGIPLARLLQPEEVAQAVWFLATSPFCNGSILNASGGNVRSVAS